MQTRKVVMNTNFNGFFDLSYIAKVWIAERKRMKFADFNIWELSRDDQDLVAIVEGLGPLANTDHSTLRVVELSNWENEA
jgi:hypothetical protein